MNDTTNEIIKVTMINGTVLGVVSFSDIETGLRIVLLLLTITWTVWRWRRSILKDRNKEPETDL